LNKAKKKLGIPSGSLNLEVFEMLEELDIVTKVMPGKLPQRNEIMVFGDFVDGQLECVAAVQTCKVICPWVMDVICLITHPPYMNQEYTNNMFDFISDLCLTNAILPNYSKLSKYELIKHIKPKNNIKNMKENEIKKKEVEEVISESYAKCNKCITLCIDTDIEDLSKLGPFWYKAKMGYESYIYFRLRCSNREELEIQFECPTTGINQKTGSSTVGGALIYDTDADNIKNIPINNLLITLKAYIYRKIKHPTNK